MTQLEYWKQRCESAEKYISSNKTTDYKNWTTIRHTTPSAPEVVGEEEFPVDSDILKALAYISDPTEAAKKWARCGFGEEGEIYSTSEARSFLAGSRWRGEQGVGNVNCEYCGVLYHGDEPKVCCSGRDCGCMGLPINGPFVCSKGCYEMLIQKRTPTPPPTCCARWVRDRYAEWCKETKRNGKIIAGSMPEFFDYLSESPCTCQQVVLLTREEAEEWADTSYPGDDIFAISSRNYMMDMYDRISEKINQQK